MRQHSVAANLFRTHDEAAAAVERSANYEGAGFLADWHCLAGDHGFIDGRFALDHDAVDRNLFTWADAQPVADRDVVEWNILIAAIIRDATRALWRKRNQCADRT